MMRKKLLLLLCLLLLVPKASAAEEAKYVALTFDDGPSGRFTRRLLEGLESRGAKATFLLCGYRLEQYPELAEEMAASGHEIGLHGYSHKSMAQMSRRQIAQELADTQALLPAGCRVRFLRPPGGICSDGVQDVAEAMGLAILSWSVDPRDWATHDTAAVDKSVFRTAQDGDIILLHDMTDSSVDAALQIVDELQRQGFRFVTVSELARLRGTNIKAGKSYSSFPPDSANSSEIGAKR